MTTAAANTIQSVKLYTFKLSLWAAVPRLLIAEKAIPNVEEVDVDLSKAENHAPDYLKMNPHATVPTLEVINHKDVHTILTDSITVTEYLDQQAGSPLHPEGGEKERREMEELIQAMHGRYDLGNQVFFTSGSLSEIETKRSLISPFLQGRIEAWKSYAAADGTTSEDRTRYERLIQETEPMLAVYQGTTSPSSMFDINRKYWDTLTEFLDQIESRLQKDDRPYLTGQRYTLADIHFTPYLHRLAIINPDIVFQNRAALIGYYERVKRRDSFAVVFG
ncbi:hypothetical protein EC973_000943 [Apophysomyces ossiformis]|uniref:Glutathione S-transferase n=1 Tax=Apophysomyces ossiformis TaxID=679940 RepID=A0A8H7EPN4_9FUNG|nr:hypothetical protein EC973_000943 [Apophysomyces ossiformis]